VKTWFNVSNVTEVRNRLEHAAVQLYLNIKRYIRMDMRCIVRLIRAWQRNIIEVHRIVHISSHDLLVRYDDRNKMLCLHRTNDEMQSYVKLLIHIGNLYTFVVFQCGILYAFTKLSKPSQSRGHFSKQRSGKLARLGFGTSLK
jgi:hypothetical protein